MNKLLARSLVFLLFNLLLMNTGKAQNREPFVRIARIVVDSAQLDAYKSILKTGIETAVRVEPGVLTMYAVQDLKAPTHITIMETYASKAAYEAHIQTPHFKVYKSGTQSMVKSLELVDVIPVIYETKKPK
ncbi:putative quinol monooxygenase [Flavihumibacter petaseus]|uniref:ABM domain-containing protein n=1 Tax=Flavihumibacter petaseus NBRC 106054 TaxID=1220578 RepID=A0A0E9MYK5_9BACT|nr:antibiotic biosynthesis monooxygenase family protein [Flavihumibacter petaseus]GAO42674.1 hypothetical protein FPE01S_01_16890 [Flavihumibacter petaseus NBRC 106054]